jgi:hypothetical protein
MNIGQHYIKEIKDQTGYTATWFPWVAVSAGDVGTITSDYGYQPLTTLKQMGIPFEVETGNVRTDFDYASKDKVEVSINVLADAPLVGTGVSEAQGRVSVKFGKSNATLFRIINCKSAVIKDQAPIRDEVLRMFESKQWNKDTVIVTETVTAKGTIIVSSGDNAQIDFAVKGSVGTPEFDLANMGGKFQITNESQIAIKIVAKENITPLFKISGIKKSLLKGPQYVAKEEGARDDGSEERRNPFNEVEYEEFLSE